ncbi:hypothetical protein EDC94DRAFT_625480 [Helicostylum pulchrum]|nr:hypothetical protein EDC94DRAFT_625480 [Helicostylum pulchrum]
MAVKLYLFVTACMGSTFSMLHLLWSCYFTPIFKLKQRKIPNLVQYNIILILSYYMSSLRLKI